VSGLLMRLGWPLALMGSADRVPFCYADSRCPGHLSGLLDPRSDPVRHHLTSSLPTWLAVLLRGSGLVGLVAGEHRPDDAGRLVGHGNGDQAHGLALEQ
jgi:hypothetical protein